ncbi:hypothetical protein Psal006b_00633 [Piscirickettsia salmonis]|uniref:Two-component sensor histidine kinase n=1 Tax=Piscirickettsia salmonis TaxID=1238 RepID=A0A1L6TE90_PISSA|nr:hypothetical protein [Piscirickettsia salmonis]ALB23735.1 two-component sensor histidine kinase [Piscirickettsia salmonis]ALT18653.1 hypothetical protein PSLF89_07400 [Piscirickettsia salmonis LF-89 = ATCC VR-1361]ALY03586.1 hypothetical protein AWE47_12615 [Piscirickettsia salmonis]AMA43151.1 hypothetical protein AWJ11_12845 [Piscirickettsia salmonis]AOS35622.1 hypothetical protein AVM72_09970 [Piscirickettsia salmonis]
MRFKKITLACGFSALVLSISSFAGDFSGINYSSTNSDDNPNNGSYTVVVDKSGNAEPCKGTATVSDFAYTENTEAQGHGSLSFNITFSDLATAEAQCSFSTADSPFVDNTVYKVVSSTTEGVPYALTITDSKGHEITNAVPNMPVQAVYNSDTSKLSTAISSIYGVQGSYNVYVLR